MSIPVSVMGNAYISKTFLQMSTIKSKSQKHSNRVTVSDVIEIHIVSWCCREKYFWNMNVTWTVIPSQGHPLSHTGRRWGHGAGKGMQTLKTLKNMLSPKRPEITRVGKDVEKREPSCTIGNRNWCGHSRKQYGIPQKLKTEVLYSTVVPLLGIYLKEMKTGSRRGICTTRLIAALLTMSGT